MQFGDCNNAHGAGLQNVTITPASETIYSVDNYQSCHALQKAGVKEGGYSACYLARSASKDPDLGGIRINSCKRWLRELNRTRVVRAYLDVTLEDGVACSTSHPANTSSILSSSVVRGRCTTAQSANCEMSNLAIICRESRRYCEESLQSRSETLD